MDLEATSYEAPAMPSELAGPVPRKVELNFDGDAPFVLIIVLLFFVGGLIFFGWTGYDDVKQFQQRALLRDGAGEVNGQVTGFSFGRYSPTSVNYEFTVNGVTYSGKALEPSSPGPGTSFDRGDKILVRYLSSDPAINHPDAWEWSASIGWYFVAAEVLFTSVGGSMSVFLLRNRKLARRGKAAVAIVTGCTRDDRSFRVAYEFRTEGGLLIRGRDDFREEYGAGARIWILYLPQKPKRNGRYPLTLFSVVG